jgi:hypothetical protein
MPAEPMIEASLQHVNYCLGSCRFGHLQGGACMRAIASYCRLMTRATRFYSATRQHNAAAPLANFYSAALARNCSAVDTERCYGSGYGQKFGAT